MHEMTKQELNHLHSVLFFMLKDFDQLCRKHHIQYFLAGGTLLGAIRQKDFIPWDDDMDLMMLREDYEKLCQLPRDAFPPHLFLQTPDTDHNYHGDMAKLRLNGTVYRTEFSSKFARMHQGIFIDIFVHDKTSNKKIGQKLHVFFTAFARSAVFHKWSKTPMQYYGKYPFICLVATWVNGLFPMLFWEWLREKIYCFYKKCTTDFLYDGMGQHLQHGAFPTEWLMSSVPVEFHGDHFPAPWRYEDYLKYSYGDYLAVPAEHERKTHKIEQVDFGTYNF